MPNKIEEQLSEQMTAIHQEINKLLRNNEKMDEAKISRIGNLSNVYKTLVMTALTLTNSTKDKETK